jgi:hypothetical protein
MATHDVQWYRVRKVLHSYPRERRQARPARRAAAGRLPAVPVSSLAIFFSREHKQMPGGDHMRMHQRSRKALRCTVPAFLQHSADLSRTEALS